MENKNKILQKILFNKYKNKNINIFNSCFELKEYKNKDKQNNNPKINKYIKKEKEKENQNKKGSKENKSISKAINKIIWNKLLNYKEEINKMNINREKKLSTIELDINHSKKNSYQKIINMSINKEMKNQKKSRHATMGKRSTTFQVFKIKELKKAFRFNLNILNNPINNIRTIDTELAGGNGRENENINSKEKEINLNFKNIIKKFKENQDDIDLVSTNQDTKYKSEKYLSKILFNIKKYKKLFLKYKKENDVLKNENSNLKKEIQDTKDELDIMKEEIELNKDNNKENEKKFNELANFVKQNTVNYEQKIYNLKQLLFTKDEEINKLNKIIDNIDEKNIKIIEELKNKLLIKKKTIQNQQKLINELKSK